MKAIVLILALSGTAFAGTGPVSVLPSARLPVELSTQTLKSAAFSLSATGTVVSAVVGKKIRVYAVKLVVSAAISVNFRDGATTALEGAMPLAANGGFVEIIPPPFYVFQTTVGNSLDLVISGTGTASGRISFWEE